MVYVSALTLAVSMFTAFLVWRANTQATAQRGLAAQREEWWRRFQWGAEMALDSGHTSRRNLGVQITLSLLDSPLASQDELAAAYSLLDVVVESGENEGEEDYNSDES